MRSESGLRPHVCAVGTHADGIDFSEGMTKWHMPSLPHSVQSSAYSGGDMDAADEERLAKKRKAEQKLSKPLKPAKSPKPPKPFTKWPPKPLNVPPEQSDKRSMVPAVGTDEEGGANEAAAANHAAFADEDAAAALGAAAADRIIERGLGDSEPLASGSGATSALPELHAPVAGKAKVRSRRVAPTPLSQALLDGVRNAPHIDDAVALRHALEEFPDDANSIANFGAYTGGDLVRPPNARPTMETPGATASFRTPSSAAKESAAALQGGQVPPPATSAQSSTTMPAIAFGRKATGYGCSSFATGVPSTKARPTGLSAGKLAVAPDSAAQVQPLVPAPAPVPAPAAAGYSKRKRTPAGPHCRRCNCPTGDVPLQMGMCPECALVRLHSAQLDVGDHSSTSRHAAAPRATMPALRLSCVMTPARVRLPTAGVRPLRLTGVSPSARLDGCQIGERGCERSRRISLLDGCCRWTQGVHQAEGHGDRVGRWRQRHH